MTSKVEKKQAKSELYARRHLGKEPQKNPVTNEKVLDAIHEGTKDNKFKEEKIFYDDLKRWSLLLAQGKLPEGFDTPEEFEEYVLGIIKEKPGS